MQLTEMKMSGFKSFVDATTVPFPGKLIAVVGPNGCGKSNIIDAVTWVMGESSPKYLRGESLTDVIFNGSSARKPIGQASVELVFDNSDGTLGGEYAKFSQISVKRLINRESDSSYYLNGVRCRKRDIVDLFLGTGLGPRSYSIIGQNMIGRIIEAKPDDLRTYLEEAAGISKYKERRHETELRINHTKENLARVNDVNAELEKQLNHLKHQATVAEKYKTLKQQERVLRAELYAIQWRMLDSQMVDFSLKIQHDETALEARNAELTGTDRDIEQLRHEQRVAQDAFQEVQRRYYSVGNEITRIEQEVLHQQERQQQWENDLSQTEQDWQGLKDQIAESEEESHELEQDIMQTEPKHKHAEREFTMQEERVQIAEEATQTWQAEWDEFQQTAAKSSQTAQVEKTHIQHLEQNILSLQKRDSQLKQDQEKFNFDEIKRELAEFEQKSHEVAEKLDYSAQQLDDVKSEIQTLQGVQQDSNANLDRLRNELQRARGQQASLEALQQTALGQRDNSTAPWVNKYELGAKPRLAQHVQVQQGWELAVEKVLGFCLQAICVDDVKALAPHFEELKAGNLCIFNPGQTVASSTSQDADTLLSKVNAPWSLDSLLAGIYVADSFEDGLNIAANLAPHESVVTKDGVWMNRAWVKILRESDPALGVFQREEELKQLAIKIEQLQDTQQELEANIAERTTNLRQLEQQRDQLQQQLNQMQNAASQLNVQRKVKQERLVELQQQSERFLTEQRECAQQLQQAEQELLTARDHWQEAMQELESQADRRDALMQEREQVRQALQSAREKARQLKEELHEFDLRMQTARSQKSSLMQNIGRMQNQLLTLNERKITLQSELSSIPPIDTLKKSLDRALDKHVSVESELNTARIATEALEQEFKSLEEKRQIIERDINKVRSSLETLRVDSQSYKVRAATLVEQIAATEFKLEDVLKELPQDITAEEWQAKLDQVVSRVARLGAINLVAIEEYATCLERKQYLDQQIDDLQSGLLTLEEAIAKIDRETRQRFKETFDEVNNRFQDLFPTIFGGGKAYLELTSDNLLEAGVTMMACPPGKRNSSIYLLSGGEKSLTALALIFSIFYLNPAPFCLLDEVDAALDDANVVRFTRLVKSMAGKTQFIFISHNKISIEMGEHLIGVTMNEPGVSRLVSVDIEKAMKMVEEA